MRVCRHLLAPENQHRDKKHQLPTQFNSTYAPLLVFCLYERRYAKNKITQTHENIFIKDIFINADVNIYLLIGTNARINPCFCVRVIFFWTPTERARTQRNSFLFSLCWAYFLFKRNYANQWDCVVLTLNSFKFISFSDSFVALFVFQIKS